MSHPHSLPQPTHAPTHRPLRTSSLQAPIMLLTGHAGEVFSAEFSPDGACIASASFDRQIYLWRTFGECENYAAMIGHGGAILDIHWSTDGGKLVTASSDKTCAVWDAVTGERIRRLRGHGSIVNSCSPARASPMLASGSDDGTIKVPRKHPSHAPANRACRWRRVSCTLYPHLLFLEPVLK